MGTASVNYTWSPQGSRALDYSEAEGIDLISGGGENTAYNNKSSGEDEC